MTMPKEFYRTGRYSVDHSTYGGEITSFDFEGHNTIQSMTDKILSSWRFDQSCIKNTNNKLK